MEPPKLEFPCDYALKVVGDAADDFGEAVAEVVKQHDPGFDASSIQLVESRNGRFLSARLTMHATGEEQIKALFEALKATGRVHMVI
jgi:putative lipoic acid-binding regulatory protein